MLTPGYFHAAGASVTISTKGMMKALALEEGRCFEAFRGSARGRGCPYCSERGLVGDAGKNSQEDGYVPGVPATTRCALLRRYLREEARSLAGKLLGLAHVLSRQAEDVGDARLSLVVPMRHASRCCWLTSCWPTRRPLLRDVQRFSRSRCATGLFAIRIRGH